jgi:hypothetical protein
MTVDLGLTLFCGACILCVLCVFRGLMQTHFENAFERALGVYVRKGGPEQTGEAHSSKVEDKRALRKLGVWAWLLLGKGPDVKGIDVAFVVVPLNIESEQRRMNETVSESATQSSKQITRQSPKGPSRRVTGPRTGIDVEAEKQAGKQAEDRHKHKKRLT